MTYCYHLTSHYVSRLGMTRKDNIKIDLKETVWLDLEWINQDENRDVWLLLTGHWIVTELPRGEAFPVPLFIPQIWRALTLDRTRKQFQTTSIFNYYSVVIDWHKMEMIVRIYSRKFQSGSQKPISPFSQQSFSPILKKPYNTSLITALQPHSLKTLQPILTTALQPHSLNSHSVPLSQSPSVPLITALQSRSLKSPSALFHNNSSVPFSKSPSVPLS